MLAGPGVFFGISEWVRGVAWASADAAAAAFAFAVFIAELIAFAISVVALAILTGLIAAASWWLEALGVSAHVFA